MNQSIIYYLKAAAEDMERGAYDKALTSLSAALAYEPNDHVAVEVLFQTAVCRYHLEEYAEAADCLKTALHVAAALPYADKEHLYELQRLVYRKSLHFQELADSCQQALAQTDDQAELLSELLFACKKSNAWDKAVEVLDTRLSTAMNTGDLADKVMCLMHVGRYSEAFAAAQEYIERFGEDRSLCAQLMQLYYEAGEPSKGFAVFQKALALTDNPAGRLKLSSVLLAKDSYHGELDDAAFFKIIEGMRRDSAMLETGRTFQNAQKPFKKIRLGYLSADLHAHPVGYFLLPVMVNTMTSHGFIKCYSVTPHVLLDDTVAQQIRANADDWADVYERPDDYIEEMFVRDGVDIAFDMMCHSENNRLSLFARRLAPVQISWIGFPMTSGVHAMDYVITDTDTDPKGFSEKYYTEKLLYLPHTYLCHILGGNPTVAPPASVHNGYITFACFHNMVKITDKTLGLWRRILEQTETAVLRVMGHIPPGEARGLIEERFRRAGLPMARVHISPMCGMSEYYAAYNDVDIMLDTYPFSGATTTFDAFKMGRPIISLAGDRHVTRVGYGMLKNVGLEELAAFTDDEYVEKAVRLANDPERLRRINAELPERLASSALTDQLAFRRNYEKAIRDVWVQHCLTRSVPYDYRMDELPELLEQVVNATVYLERVREAGERVAEVLMDEYAGVQAAFYEKLQTIVTDEAFMDGYGKLVGVLGQRLDEKNFGAALALAKRYLNVFCDGEL